MNTFTDSNKIFYVGKDDNNRQNVRVMHWTKALEQGTEFKVKDVYFTLAPKSELIYYMHKHARNLHVKLTSNYERTIAEIYIYDPLILLNLLEFHGGKQFLGEILIKLDELNKQQEELEQWQNDLW